jgi:sugar lactone lactonase YvrE
MAMLFALVTHIEGQVAKPATGASYRLVEPWTQLPPGQQFGNMTGITLDAKDMVYAARRCPMKCGYLTEGAGDPMGSVLVWDPRGKFLREWKDVVHETHGLYIDHNGFFWATDIQKHQVKKFQTDGTLVMTLGKYGVRDGTTPDTFNQPTHVVVVPPNDDIFVSDGYGGLCPTALPGCDKGSPVTTMRIVKFNKDGKFVKAWGKRGKGPGEFRVPHSIAADSRGRIFVADRCGRSSEPVCADGRVQIFDGDGTFLEQWAPPGAGGFSPMGVFIDKADRLYIGDAENSTIWIVDARSGKVLETIEHQRIRGIHHLAVNSAGDIYTASLMGGLQRYTRNR